MYTLSCVCAAEFIADFGFGFGFGDGDGGDGGGCGVDAETEYRLPSVCTRNAEYKYRPSVVILYPVGELAIRNYLGASKYRNDGNAVVLDILIGIQSKVQAVNVTR